MGVKSRRERSYKASIPWFHEQYLLQDHRTSICTINKRGRKLDILILRQFQRDIYVVMVRLMWRSTMVQASLISIGCSVQKRASTSFLINDLKVT